ncbi:MAG: hypothetical protein RL745_738 [Actinomycetota bacterium]
MFGISADGWALGIALVGICTTGPIITASTAPVFALAAWRCLLGALFIGVFLMGRQWRVLASMDPRAWKASIVAGVLLGLHFAVWIPSLRYTTVASSTALVATQPVWAALIARLRGRPVPARLMAGIVIAIIGAAVLAGSDFAFTSSRALFGDALALAGAIGAAAYVTAGESARQRIPTLPYSMIAYTCAAVVLFITCAFSGTSLFRYNSNQWQSILLLTLCGQVLGHTLINKSLRSVSATVASTAILFEMPGSTLIAAVWIHQSPPLQVWPALLLVLVGMFVVVRSQSRASAPPVD